MILAVSLFLLTITAAAARPPKPRAKTAPRARAAAPRVLGKLAMVSAREATLRARPETQARALSIVPRNTYLAITRQQGEYYGVLMINRTTGWVHRSQVRMIPYQMAMSSPGGTPPAKPSAPPRKPSASPPPAAKPPPRRTAATPKPPTRTAAVPTKTRKQAATATSEALVPKGLDARTQALLRRALAYREPLTGSRAQNANLDASLFVRRVFAAQGISLPRYAREQAAVGIPVKWQNLEAGDRLYFDLEGTGRINHTGIYLGKGRFIHAAPGSGEVTVLSLFLPRFYNAILTARR